VQRPTLYEQVRREQAKALVAVLPHVLAGNLANLAVALFAASDVLEAPVAAGWAAVLLLTLLARIPLFLSRRVAADPERALGLHAIGAGGTGCAWALLFLLVPPLPDFPGGTWLAFQVAGLSAGATILDVASWRVVAAFTVPLLSGFALHLVLRVGDGGALALAGLVLVYGAMLLHTARLAERRFVRLARLSAERPRMLEHMLEERRAAEERRAKIETECARLREMVEALPLPLALFAPDGSGPRLANAAFERLITRGGVYLLARAMSLAREAAADARTRERVELEQEEVLLQARAGEAGVLVWGLPVPVAGGAANGNGVGEAAHAPFGALMSGPGPPHDPPPG